MTDTDRDAAPAAAEGADLSTERLDEIERTAIAASRYAAEPYRVVKDKWGVRLEEVTGGILAEHGELPEDDPYFTLLTLLPPSVVIALVRAARPAPAAAPREGGEHRCVGCRSGLCEIPDARLCDDCQQGLSRETARGEGDTP